MTNGALEWLELHSKDFEATKSFYGSVFGWKFNEDMGPSYLMFEDTKGNGGGFSTEIPVSTGGPLLFLTADSIEKTLPQIAEAGGKAEKEKTLIDETIGWWATFKDPSGNVLGLYEKKPAH